MALARVKTWNAGDILTAADLNAEYNNILNNPISLVSPTTGVINFNLQAHSNILPSALSASSGSTGNQLLVSSGGTPIWSSTGATAAVSVGSRVKGLLGDAAATASSQTLTLSFDECILRTTGSTGTLLMASTATFTVLVGTTGAGGRDVSAAFSSTFIHAYSISTGSGSTTPRGLLSTSFPNPVMPTSYSHLAYLGTYSYSSASTSFAVSQRANGSWVYNDIQQKILNNGGASSTTFVSLSTAVPVQANKFQLFIDGQGANQIINFLITSSNNAFLSKDTTDPTSVWTMVVPNVTTTPGIWYYWNTAPAAGGDINFMGYQVPNGDL